MQLQLSWIHVSKTGMSIKIFLHVRIDYCHCHIEYISSLVMYYFKWYCINAIFNESEPELDNSSQQFFRRTMLKSNATSGVDAC